MGQKIPQPPPQRQEPKPGRSHVKKGVNPPGSSVKPPPPRPPPPVKKI